MRFLQNLFAKKSISELLTALTNEQFNRVVNETTLAMFWHDVGYGKAQGVIFLAENGASDYAIRGYMYHGKIRDRIVNSEFYRQLRLEGIWRYNLPLLNKWTGWIGLSEAQRETAKGSLINILRDTYPSIFGGSDAEEIATAHYYLKTLGLTGLFIDWKNPVHEIDLEEAFRKAKLK